MGVLLNRAKMTTATTGTGTLTLGSAVTGYQSFADAGLTDGQTVTYVIEDDAGAWEVGTGTYTASGTTLSRSVTESSNSGAAINLSGNAYVFASISAADLGAFATLTGTETLTNKSLTSPSITGTILEDVYTISGTSVTLDPDNGSLQTHTLTGATTYTDGLSSGESIALIIDDGAAHTITWPTMTWVNNAATAPTLATDAKTVVALWKISTTLYGALVGDGT